ncbi:type VII secretion target [Nocardia sp. NPDC056000]|uniref:type VII secretion target n=1 Tax=Nocardia sp. NPDC056000 TaxID=3345674 RepID=UPI0035DFF642
MRVSPEELRKAATTVEGFADRIGKAPVRDGEPIVDAIAGVLRGGPAIAAALHTVDPAMKKAVTVATGRFQEIAAIFRTSADEYHGTDVDSAARLDALGDLNAGVSPA